jgi:hypothetical protein
MRRIHRQRRHERENVTVVVVAQRPLVGGGERVGGRDVYVVLRKRHEQLREQASLVGLDLADHGVAFGYLLLRRTAVDRELLNARGNLLLEAADALHEELVQVRRRDGEEADPLEQRVAAILRFSEDATIERESGELAIEVDPGCVGLRVWQRRHRGRDRFGRSPPYHRLSPFGPADRRSGTAPSL